MAAVVAVALQPAACVAATHSNTAMASSSAAAAATAAAAAAEGEFVPPTFVAVSWTVSLRI